MDQYPPAFIDAIRFHGHVCQGLLIGYRAVKVAHFEWWFLPVEQKRGTLWIIRLLKLLCRSKGRGAYNCCANYLTKNSFQKILLFTE